MAWTKHWVKPIEDRLAVGGHNHADFHAPDEFLKIIRETRFLAALKAHFPAPRRQLIQALEHFGFDFMELLCTQIRDGKNDSELAALHVVDAKWIADIRGKLGIPSHRERPSRQVADEILRDAYANHKNYAGAARELGMDPRTFGRRYRAAVRRLAQ